MKERFGLDIRRKFIAVRVVRYWKRLPREVCGCPILDNFKARLEGALSSLVWRAVLDLDDLQGPFPLLNILWFYDSMTLPPEHTRREGRPEKPTKRRGIVRIN